MVRKIIITIMVLVFLTGLGFFLYPYAQGALIDWEIQENAEDFHSRVEVHPTTGNTSTVIIDTTEPTEEQLYPELWADMTAYNETIYAEGQRRYMESLSSYARQFLGQMEKPNVESIEGLSPSLSLLNFLNICLMKMAVSINDRKSDMTKLYHTPSVPMSSGRVYRHGSRNRSCLERDRNMDLFTIPRLWKKLVPIIWKPTKGNIIVSILRAVDARDISSSSWVNIPTAAFGMNIPIRKHAVVMMVANFAVFQNTSLTLAYCLAP